MRAGDTKVEAGDGIDLLKRPFEQALGVGGVLRQVLSWSLQPCRCLDFSTYNSFGILTSRTAREQISVGLSKSLS